MTQEEKKSCQKKNYLLEVKRIDPITYLVQSQSDPSMYYKAKLNGSNSCDCADWKRNHEADPSWACNHIAAALDLKAQADRIETRQQAGNNGNGKLSPQDKERINLEIAALYGDQEAIGKLNGQAKAPRVTLAVVEEELTPCSLCGAMFPSPDLLPWSGTGSSGFICRECNGEIQAELSREREAIQAIETPRAMTLAERVQKANDILEGFGPAAIETDQKGYTGYGAQYVMDAVNQALGFDSWRYEILDHQIEKAGEKTSRAFVMLQLSIRLDDGSWLSKGPVFGGSQNGDPADALKGAVTDALKKAGSYWSIGNRAYRGELKAAAGK